MVDPAAGERLRGLAFQYDTWVVPSDANRAVVKEIWEWSKERGHGRSVTYWSSPMPAVTKEDWLAMLDTIEVHHGAYWCEPPLDTLSVYGAAITPAITVALREYEYDTVKPTALGFLAFKRRRSA